MRAFRSQFQSTHPHGVRLGGDLVADAPKQFQSTHPHGVRPYTAQLDTGRTWFQSTHPHGVRLPICPPLHNGLSFNPRTRMGCDPADVKVGRFDLVSIHAPAWGATCPRLQAHLCRICFNPRTRMGCDTLPSVIVTGSPSFQSTHPHGVRQHSAGYLRQDVRFNPRTRMGCDALYFTPNTSLCSFNPRTRMGCDIASWRSRHPSPGFNPRTRMGCDRQTSLSLSARRCFNPRTRMGCDANADLERVHVLVSIHAPAWGATQRGRHYYTGQRFQSTHPHGVRLVIDPLAAFLGPFQSTHPHGVRPATTSAPARQLSVSIHAPAWGATCAAGSSRPSTAGFNPRTRMGCDAMFRACAGV